VFGEGQGPKQLAEQLGRDHLYVDASRLVTFLGLHDVDRFLNTKGSDTTGLRNAYTFLFTTRGIPLVYYGDEVALRGGGDPDNRRDFPGGWAGDGHDAFRATGRTTEEAAVWDHVKRVLRVRAGSAALRRGKLVTLRVDDWTYAYARVAEGEAVVAVFNQGRDGADLAVPLEGIGAKLLPGAADLLDGGDAASDGTTLRLRVPARGARVVALRTEGGPGIRGRR
jgi:glycosidase